MCFVAHGARNSQADLERRCGLAALPDFLAGTWPRGSDAGDITGCTGSPQADRAEQISPASEGGRYTRFLPPVTSHELPVTLFCYITPAGASN